MKSLSKISILCCLLIHLLSPSTVPQYLLQQIPTVLSHIHPRHHTQLDPHRQILLPPWRE